MGLFDRSKRQQDPPPDYYVKLGKLEGDVESLRIQWESYKDEIRRLLQRLEKRDQRAAERAAHGNGDQQMTPIRERVLRRRNRVSTAFS